VNLANKLAVCMDQTDAPDRASPENVNSDVARRDIAATIPDKSDHRHCRLLRTRRERQCRCTDAE
jgi:hypothetical protein